MYPVQSGYPNEAAGLGVTPQSAGTSGSWQSNPSPCSPHVWGSSSPDAPHVQTQQSPGEGRRANRKRPHKDLSAVSSEVYVHQTCVDSDSKGHPACIRPGLRILLQSGSSFALPGVCSRAKHNTQSVLLCSIFIAPCAHTIFPDEWLVGKTEEHKRTKQNETKVAAAKACASTFYVKCAQNDNTRQQDHEAIFLTSLPLSKNESTKLSGKRLELATPH